MKTLKPLLFLLVINIFLLTGCGESTESKMKEIKSAYSNLLAQHETAISVHDSITSSELDSVLLSLEEDLLAIHEDDLNLLKEDALNSLLNQIVNLTASYEEVILQMSQIKENEDAAVLIPIMVTLHNHSDQPLYEIYLLSGDTYSSPENLEPNQNILKDLAPLNHGEHLVGLEIYKNVQNTPWFLIVCNKKHSDEIPDERDIDEDSSLETEETDTEDLYDYYTVFELKVEDFSESDVSISLTEEENETLTITID